MAAGARSFRRRAAGAAAARSRGGVIVGPPGGRRPGGYGWGYGGGGWSGYRVHGGLRGYYGLGVGYWGGPWIYPPYYGDWVFFWGPSYYPARPSMEVLELGLPEGVLPPGGRVSGYLYFKRATGARQGALDLSWDDPRRADRRVARQPARPARSRASLARPWRELLAVAETDTLVTP